MTVEDEVRNKYYEWLTDLVCGSFGQKKHKFSKLLTHLHLTEFRYSIPRDENRARGGIGMRYRFAYYHKNIENAESYLSGPCSVLEMMVALSIACEELMDDFDIGDRTGQWFWGMINSLGLGSMVNDIFDKRYVMDTIERFLDREYESDGRGGLFTVKGRDRDLRDVEIWYQMNWYLDSIV